MKLVILAGGLGTRISEETEFIPKPMIMIGNRPMIWHIMKYYSCYEIKDFIICGGYKLQKIKNFFSFQKNKEDWNVNIVNTGKNSNTGKRILKIKKFINKNEKFYLTYGDGLSNIKIDALLSFHNKNKSIFTISAVKPPSRFGKLIISKNKIKKFYEKEKRNENWISGGFFVCEYNIFNFLSSKNPIFEKETIPKMIKKSKIYAFKHNKFWHPMDTMQEKRVLNDLWKKGKAPWKIW